MKLKIGDLICDDEYNLKEIGIIVKKNDRLTNIYKQDVYEIYWLNTEKTEQLFEIAVKEYKEKFLYLVNDDATNR